MQRALALSLLLLTAALPSRAPAKTQWAPSGSFSALHTRAVFSSETEVASRPCARERLETAAGFRFFLSRDSIGAESRLTAPNGIGPWSYAGLNPARYVDPDGRSEADLRCIMDGQSDCNIFGGGSLAPLALRVRDARVAVGAARGDSARAVAVERYASLLGRFERSAGWRYDFHQNVGLPVMATAAGVAVGVGAGAGLAASAPAISYYAGAAWSSGALGKAAVLGVAGAGVASVPNFVESIAGNYRDCASYSGPESLGACFGFGVDTGGFAQPAAEVAVAAPRLARQLLGQARTLAGASLELFEEALSPTAITAEGLRVPIPDVLPTTIEMSSTRKPPAGTGPYRSVKGHHVHAKAGFRGDVLYDPNEGFSISDQFMKARGWSHEDMTAMQQKLFRELAKSGRPNTIQEHSQIAVEALRAGGATKVQAERLVEWSLRNLKAQGATTPTRIPWVSP